MNTPLALEREDVARARILLAQKQPAEAIALLEPHPGQCGEAGALEPCHRDQGLAGSGVFYAQRRSKALTVLSQAVHLAEPEGYIRTFVDEDTAMETLLYRLRVQERRKGPTPYLDTLLAAFSPESVDTQASSSRQSDQLTGDANESNHS